MRRGDPTVTYTGRVVYPLEPREEDVDILDIAHGLAMSCRYSNQALEHYSVAEHSVILSLYVPSALRPEALLHDADEFIIPDLPHGLKHSSDPVFHAAMQAYRDAGRQWQETIFRQFGVWSTPETRAIIKTYDNRIVLDESAAMMSCPEFYREKPDLAHLKPLGANICGLPWTHAERVFLQRFRELFPEFAELTHE